MHAVTEFGVLTFPHRLVTVATIYLLDDICPFRSSAIFSP